MKNKPGYSGGSHRLGFDLISGKMELDLIGALLQGKIWRFNLIGVAGGSSEDFILLVV